MGAYKYINMMLEQQYIWDALLSKPATFLLRLIVVLSKNIALYWGQMMNEKWVTHKLLAMWHVSKNRRKFDHFE